MGLNLHWIISRIKKKLATFFWATNTAATFFFVKRGVKMLFRHSHSDIYVMSLTSLIDGSTFHSCFISVMEKSWTKRWNKKAYGFFTHTLKHTPGIPTTIKTMGVNITTIVYLRVLIIQIGSTIILMVVED